MFLAGTATAAQNIAVGLIISGEFGDMSFWDTALDGMKKLSEVPGVRTKIYECASDESVFESELLKAAAECDLLFVAGSELKKFLHATADANPDTDFVCLDYEFTGQPKVASVVFKESEGSFLAGVLAGIMTNRADVGKVASGQSVVGFVGGYDVPSIRRYLSGYRQGIEYVNPKATILVEFVDSWSSFEKGRDAAIRQYKSGADIVFHASGGSGLGVIQAGRQAGRYVIGVDAEQEKFAGGVVLASVVKRLDRVIFRITEKFVSGTYESGRQYSLGLREEGIGLSYWSEEARLAIPPDVVDVLADAESDIKSGKIAIE